MPDDRVKISALDSASTMETGDMFPVTQERNGVKKTNKAFMSQIASEVVNGIEYTTALDTDDKKPIGAINELLDRLIALLPVVSFSPTPIATITDGAENIPMKSLICEIVPKETGTGTKSPSNPYVISGSDEVVITHAGANLFDKTTATTGGWLNANGGVNSGSNRAYSDYIAIKLNQPYYFEHVIGSNSLTTCIVYDSNKTIIGQSTLTGSTDRSGTLTFTSGAYIRVNTTADKLDEMQISVGSTAPSEYHAYQTPTTETVALPSTVYGGEVDVVSGQGKETHNIIDLGDLIWTKNSSTLSVTIFTALVSGRKVGNLSGICSDYEVSSDTRTYLETHDNCLTRWNTTSSDICLRDDSKSSMSGTEIKAALSGVKLVYELATPTPITTTPTTIKTKGGTESIWSDTGDVSGEYRADIQKYIDGLVNNGGNRSLNSLNLSKGAIEEEPKKEEVKEEEPKEEEKK